ncbi:MAG: tripartite tricarboxylate transporter TctB family protein [Clostridiales bacterium]|nr:tripartite tricarboxylate transporter TctB family protein [Clostridiales bacterium]
MKDQLDRLDARLDAIGKRLGEKELRFPVDLVTGILFALFALVILWVMPDQVVVSEKDVVNGRAFPTLLMAVMLLCCVMLIGKELYKLATKQPLTWKTINLLVEIKALIILAILAGTYFLSKLTGLFVVGGVFCCLGFLIYFRCRKPSYYIITVALAVGIWAAFRFVLGVDF